MAHYLGCPMARFRRVRSSSVRLGRSPQSSVVLTMAHYFGCPMARLRRFQSYVAPPGQRLQSCVEPKERFPCRPPAFR
jgi:hypothetical protein